MAIAWIIEMWSIVCFAMYYSKADEDGQISSSIFFCMAHFVWIPVLVMSSIARELS